MITLEKNFTVVNSSQEEINFYFEDQSAKVKEKLDDLITFPQWNDALSSFCQLWTFDDITKGSKLTMSEEIVLRTVIQDSMGNSFYNLKKVGSNATDIYNEVTSRMRQRFPREVKDGIWKKVLVDKFCSNTGEVMRIFDNIILLEMGTWDAEADSPLSNKSINTRVYRCLHRDLQDKILMFGISIDKIFSETPRNLIKNLVSFTNSIKGWCCCQWNISFD